MGWNDKWSNLYLFIHESASNLYERSDDVRARAITVLAPPLKRAEALRASCEGWLASKLSRGQPVSKRVSDVEAHEQHAGGVRERCHAMLHQMYDLMFDVFTWEIVLCG